MTEKPANPWAPKDWDAFESDSEESSFSHSQPITPGVVVDSGPFIPAPIPEAEPVDEAPPPMAQPVRATAPLAPPILKSEAPIDAPVSVEPVVTESGVAQPVTADSPSSPEDLGADSQSQPASNSFSGSVSNIVDREDQDRTVISRVASARWVLATGSGETESFVVGTVIVGRKPEGLFGYPQAITLAVTDPTRTVSKNHALLEYIDGAWWVTDLGSTNGVALIAEDGTESVLAPRERVLMSDKAYFGDLLVELKLLGA